MEIVRPDEHDETLVQLWNKNCVGCHVSQQENNYRPATRTYATKWTDFGTSCERCHGPGSAHVRVHADAKPGATISDQLIVRPTRLDSKSSSMICAQCHSLRDVIAPGYIAGADYYDHFQPLLENRPQKARRPRLLGRRAAAPLLERCDRPLAEPVLPARRRDLHQLPPRRTCPTSTRTRSWRRRTTRSARSVTRRSARRSPSTRATPRGAPAVPASSATCRKR